MRKPFLGSVRAGDAVPNRDGKVVIMVAINVDPLLMNPRGLGFRV